MIRSTNSALWYTTNHHHNNNNKDEEEEREKAKMGGFSVCGKNRVEVREREHKEHS
jgi:hypothetical protein